MKAKTNKHYCVYFEEVISQGFILKITFPTRISEQASTLIDNINTWNIDERESSGIMLNQISDHQMVFTIIKKIVIYHVIRVPKFMEIEKNDPRSIKKFMNELEELKIYDKRKTSVNNVPEENYDIMLKLLATAKQQHLPKKMVKFDKRKHKKANWKTK